ncbi:MAG: DinB family protein [Deinococcales bacterium]
MEFNLQNACAILERTPATLKTLLHDLEHEWTSPNEGGESFSPFDVVGHLIDAEEENWLPRISLLLHSKNSTFPPFDRFRHKQRNIGRSINELLEEFSVCRAESLQKLHLLEIIPNLDRTALHPALGKVTLRQLLSTWVVHDLGHIAQITRVMAKQYKHEVGAWAEYLPILSDREAKQ